MPNLDYDRIARMVKDLYKNNSFGKVSPFFFLTDFSQKMNIAFELIRFYFQTDRLDDIAYDVVKLYFLSEYYSMDGITNLEDTNPKFYCFFDNYIQSFVQMARCVECSYEGGRK